MGSRTPKFCRGRQLLCVIGLVLVGCSAGGPRGQALWAYEARPTPNLALGPTVDHNLLTREFVGRSAWPSVDAGYQVEDVSYFSIFSYDDQSFYDRFSGGYSRQSISERVGVTIR